MELMSWLTSDELQGIAALVVVVEFMVMFVWDRLTKPTAASNSAATTIPSPVGKTASPQNVVIQIGGVVFLFVVGWIIYSSPWGVMAFALSSFDPKLPSYSLVFHFLFLVLGSLPPLGSLMAKSVIIGGFLGGALPLGLLALFLSSLDPNMQATTSPFAWFTVFFVFGGYLGAVSGPATVKLAQALKIPLPFS